MDFIVRVKYIKTIQNTQYQMLMLYQKTHKKHCIMNSKIKNKLMNTILLMNLLNCVYYSLIYSNMPLILNSLNSISPPKIYSYLIITYIKYYLIQILDSKLKKKNKNIQNKKIIMNSLKIIENNMYVYQDIYYQKLVP